MYQHVSKKKKNHAKNPKRNEQLSYFQVSEWSVLLIELGKDDGCQWLQSMITVNDYSYSIGSSHWKLDVVFNYLLHKLSFKVFEISPL